MDSENMTKNITKEILRECFPKNIKVNEEFLIYYVKLLYLDPNWGMSKDIFTSRADVQKFIKVVVEKLENQNVPGIVTLKIQLFFTCNMENREEIVQESKNQLMKELEPLLEKILTNDQAFGKENEDSAYLEMVYYACFTSGLGNPLDTEVYAEALQALKSVLPSKELIDFLSLPKAQKKEYFEQLVKIIWGIRLFNRDCKKGGEHIVDLPFVMAAALSNSHERLMLFLVEVMDKVNVLTTCIDECTAVVNQTQQYEIETRIPDEITMADFNYIKDLLIVYRQYELYLRQLVSVIEKITESSEKTIRKLRDVFDEAHKATYLRIAVQANIIFPIFTRLADTWHELQTQALMLAHLEDMKDGLSKYVSTLKFPHSTVKAILKDTKVATDAMRLSKFSNCSIELKTSVPKIKILQPSDLKQPDQIHYQYLGFCCWKLVKTQGGLIPGNPTMGVVNSMGLNYVFSQPECADSFINNADSFILAVLDLARKKPELINFLQLKRQLEIVQSIETLLDRPTKLKNVVEEETQTVDVDYPEDYKEKNRNYKWNIWDLRKDAIKLANLCKCTTRGTQTLKMFSKFGVGVQATSYADKALQTKRDNYTSVPSIRTYFFGLRGRRDDKQFVVDLTPPVDH